MRISKVRVQNFRSIEDTGFVDLNEGITSLVGRNGAGKTNFLRALASLHPSETYDESDLCRYNVLDIDDSESIPIVTVVFEYNMDDHTLLPDDLNDNQTVEIELTRKFDQRYFATYHNDKSEKSVVVSSGGEKIRNEIDNVVDDMPNTQAILNSSGKAEREARNKMQEIDSFYSSINKNYSARQYTEAVNEMTEKMGELTRLLDSKNIYNKINNIYKKLININNRIVIYAETASILECEINEGVEAGLFNAIQDIPSVIFHDELEMLPDQVQIGGDSDSVELTFDLLELAQISDDDLERRDGAELERMLRQRVAEALQLVSDEWQRELNFDLRYNQFDEELRLTVIDENEPNYAKIRPSDRSDGLQYFISFCLNILLQFESEFQDSIMLFDGPGQQLHPGAKRDLLNVFENIAGDSQIVYSTHSPFLIDGEHLDRVRVVKRDDAEEPGTKVTSLCEDEQDTVEPVWAALGANMERSPFGNEKNLLVEGYTDKVYFEAISKYLRKQGDQDSALDIDQTTIVPVGGDGKMNYLARFAESHNYNYVSLFDNGSNKYEDVRNEEAIDESRVYRLDDFVGDLDDDAKEIEDLMSPELFFEVIQEAYPDLSQDELTEGSDQPLDRPYIPQYGINIQGTESYPDDHSIKKAQMARYVKRLIREDDCDDERLGRETLENFIALFEGIDEAFEEH